MFTSGMYLRSLLAWVGLAALSSCAGYLGFNIGHAGLPLSFDILRDTPTQVTVQLDLPFSPVNPIYDFYLDYAPLSQGAACASGSPIVTSNTTKVIPNLLPGTDYEFALCTRHRKSKVTFKETKVERTPYEFDVVLSGTVDNNTFHTLLLTGATDTNGDGQVTVGFAAGTVVELTSKVIVNTNRPSLHLFAPRGSNVTITQTGGTGGLAIISAASVTVTNTYSIENIDIETNTDGSTAVYFSGPAIIERLENLNLTTTGVNAHGISLSGSSQGRVDIIRNISISTGADGDGGENSQGIYAQGIEVGLIDNIDVQVNGLSTGSGGLGTTHALQLNSGQVGSISRVHASSSHGFPIVLNVPVTSMSDISIDNSDGGISLKSSGSIQHLNGVFIDTNGTNPGLYYYPSGAQHTHITEAQGISIITRGAGQAGFLIAGRDANCGSDVCSVISGLTIVTLGANAPALKIDNVIHQRTLIEDSHLETKNAGSYAFECDSQSARAQFRFKQTVLRTTGANAHAVYMKDNCTLMSLENVTIRRGALAAATATAFYFVDDTSGGNDFEPRVVSAQTHGLNVCSEGLFKWESLLQTGIMGNKTDAGALQFVTGFTEFIDTGLTDPQVPWGATTVPFSGGAGAVFPQTVSSYGVTLGGACSNYLAPQNP